MNNNTQRVEFDDSNIKEIEEAKSVYRKARRENRTITDLNGKALSGFRTYTQGFIIHAVELLEDQFAMRIFDETGDRRLIWEATNPAQVKEAKELFDKYIERGWKAYSLRADGTRSRRIYGFDPETLEIFFTDKTTQEMLKAVKAIAVPKEIKTTKEKLQGFVEAMKSTVLIPKTYPG